MKRLMLLLSAMGILLLAACGEREDSPHNVTDGVVYVPQMMDCELDTADPVDLCCADGQYICFTANLSSKEDWTVVTDPETGEIDAYYHLANIRLFRIPLEGGPVEQLENYIPLSNSIIWSLQSGGDGTLWVTEESGEQYVRRHLDGTGMELERQETEEPEETSGHVPGGGEYVYYYRNGDSVYGWKDGAGDGERLFSWLSAGLDSDKVDCFSVLPDGRVAAFAHDWDEHGFRKTSLAVLTPTDASALPEKTTLTMAGMWLPYTMREEIIEFNRNSPDCCIDVTDYGEYSTGTDEWAGLTRLNTEIVSGNIPDLLYTENLPIERYAAKGFLEDLWPYIEADPETGGREGLMSRVLDAASVDGRLYQAFDGFSIRTAVGPAAVVGDRMGWTLADLQAALETMPEGCTVFGVDDTRSQMLSQLLRMSMSGFVDWNAGTCSFDSDGFKALLAFCNQFPEEFAHTEDMPWESDAVRFRSGKQLLAAAEITGGFQAPQLYDWAFGRRAAFVGYPTEDGGTGSCFCLNDGLAVSSACKDKPAAWAFVRRMFLPQAGTVYYDEDFNEYYFRGFPINRSDFDKCVEGAMTTAYQTDGEGVIQTDENGEPLKLRREYWSTNESDLTLFYAATQEDVDRLMALYDAIDSVYGYDENIYAIVEEQAGAYFAGDKSLDAAVKEIQNRVHLYIGENT